MSWFVLLLRSLTDRMLRFLWRPRRRLASGRWLVWVLLLVMCLTGSCAPRSSMDAGSMARNDRLLVGTTGSIPTLDPADAYTSWSGILLYNMGDRLYTYAPNSTTLIPQLATALPDISHDGLTYRIPLRRGVIFHDGSVFNAAAMAFSLVRFMQNGGQPSFLLTDIVESIQATAEFELTIKLKQPFVAFPKVLSFFGACAVSPQAYEIGEGKFVPKNFVGTGPYKLARFGSDSVSLVAFDQYWGDRPANSGVEVQRFSNSANLFNAFRTGVIDLAYQSLSIDQILSLQQGATPQTWQVQADQGTGIYYLTVNVRSAPLDRLEVRQALAAAINRNILQERVFRGQVETLYSLVPPLLDVSRPVFRDRYGESNAQQAITLLKTAGFSPAQPAVIELWYRSNLFNNQLAATTLKAAIEQQMAGFMKIDLQSIEAVTAYRNLDKGVYPTFLLDWSADFLDADSYLQPFLDCAKGSAAQGCQEGSSHGQGSFYFSDRVNQLIRQQRQEGNPARRTQILAEIQGIAATDVPFIPLWQNKEYLFIRSGIEGAQLQAAQKMIPFAAIAKTDRRG